MSHDAHHVEHTPDREWMGLGVMAIVMIILAASLGEIATRSAPAGPGQAEERLPANEASTGLAQGTHVAPHTDQQTLEQNKNK